MPETKLFATVCRGQHSRNHCAGFTVPLPCFFPLCLADTLQIPSGATKNGLSNGTVSNRDFLSEIGLALAARVLDWTACAHLSAKSETARIAALQPTGRDNRSAGVLACPKLGGASKRLMIIIPSEQRRSPQHSTARPTWLRLSRANGVRS
jgi:hypothetical protein